MTSDESRLTRWSRRKAETRAGRGGAAPELKEEKAELPVDAATPDDAGQEAPAAETPPPDLPDIDTLTSDSDFTAFMKEGVPKAVRRQALRKLWASDPVFNFIDGMEEYGEDYTDAATVVAGMKSAWEVGKGYPKEEKPDAPAEAVETGADEEGADADSTAEKTRDEQSGIAKDTRNDPHDEDEDLG
jgi:hypothetical protein